MRRMRPTIACVVPALLCAMMLGFLCACMPMTQEASHEQKQRDSIADETTAGVAEKTFTKPTPFKMTTENAKGETTTIEIPATVHTDRTTDTTAATDAQSESWGFSFSKVSLPLSVALLIFAVGLLLLMLAGWLLLRKFAALRALTKLADSSLTSVVNSINSHARTVNDPAMNATLATLAADAERKRADLNRTVA